jgi:hypothetical protein
MCSSLCIGQSHGLLWLSRPQAKAKANRKPNIWLGLACSSHGFGFLAFWLEVKPWTSLVQSQLRVLKIYF